MSPTENPPHPPATAPSSLEELRQSFESLRSLLNAVLVILLILTASLSVILLREVSQVRRQVKEFSLIVDSYNKNNRPAMLEIRDKLYEFAKLHPDYNAIFTNFFNPAAATAGQPAPPMGSPDVESSPARMPSVPGSK